MKEWCLGGVRRKSSGDAGDPSPPSSWLQSRVLTAARNVFLRQRPEIGQSCPQKVGASTTYARIDGQNNEDQGELSRVIAELAQSVTMWKK